MDQLSFFNFSSYETGNIQGILPPLKQTFLKKKDEFESMLNSYRLNFKLTQCFGDSSTTVVTDADILSAIEFSEDGEFLATGDKGGRLVIFKKKPGKPQAKYPEYRFAMEFQSHEPEFDYLKSLDIEEKINQIQWLKPTNNASFLLSTNDKTVKLWKVHDKKTNIFQTHSSAASGSLKISGKGEPFFTATPRKIFSNAHAYHINSISPCSDGQSFISTDDLRINLWNLEVTNKCFTVTDIKPQNMEELTEVITKACFHPVNPNIIMYSTSRGLITLNDLRDSALCDKKARVLEAPEDPSKRSFFSEIVSSISDSMFCKTGQTVFSRDYLTLKIWDLRKEKEPARIINIHDQLKPRLTELYENDGIFDKFELSLNKSGSHIVTGSYGNAFKIFDRLGNETTKMEVAKHSPQKKSTKSGRLSLRSSESENSEVVDFTKKVLHLSWSPVDDLIAVAGVNKLYIYSSPSS